MSVPIKVKSLRESIRVTLHFTRPILDWQDVGQQYFGMIFDAFGSQLRVQASDLSGNPGAGTVGDIRARWSVYGGASNVTLFADRIEFDFPVLIPPSDTQLFWFILRTVHDRLPTALKSWRYDRIESGAYEHLELPPGVSVSAYLAPLG
jgi:hypothetical protein